MLILISFFFFPANAITEENRFVYSGYFKNEVAYRYVDLRSFTKIKDILKLTFRYKLNKKISFVSSLRYSYDHVYDIADPNKVNPRMDLRELGIPRIQDISAISPAGRSLIFEIPDEAKQEFDIKELFIDLSFDNADFRIGKQLVFWGSLDGFRITDNVNPVDFREFILRDIENLRIPLWMAKLDYYYKTNGYMQFLLIPDIRFHEPPSRGSEFEFFRTLPNDKIPDRSLLNTEWGVKLAGVINTMEWSLNMLSSFDDFPAAFRILETDITCENQVVVPTVQFASRHPRLLNIGGMLRGVIDDRFVIRIEAAYTTGKQFGIEPHVESCEDLSGQDKDFLEFNKILGEVEKDFIKGGAGIDFSLAGSDIAIQIMQQNIFNYDKRIMQEDNQIVISFFYRKTFYNELLIPDLLILYFMDGAQFLYRPKISYLYGDKTKLVAGIDIFAGNEGEMPGKLNFVGQFNNRDRIYIEAQLAIFD